MVFIHEEHPCAVIYSADSAKHVWCVPAEFAGLSLCASRWDSDSGTCSGVQLGTTGSLKVEADILFVLAYQCQPTETAAGQEMWESKEYLFACEGFGTRLLAFPIGAMLYGIPDAK